MHRKLSVKTSGQGLYEITEQVSAFVRSLEVVDGLCSVFIQHTSASVIIQENADPSARRDLEAWLHRLVPENDTLFSHTTEGPDDMPAHIKAVLTATSVVIPVIDGDLALGTWQGIYLWEHRDAKHNRGVIVSVL